MRFPEYRYSSFHTEYDAKTLKVAAVMLSRTRVRSAAARTLITKSNTIKLEDDIGILES
jgi:hypothetical protein